MTETLEQHAKQITLAEFGAWRYVQLRVAPKVNRVLSITHTTGKVETVVVDTSYVVGKLVHDRLDELFGDWLEIKPVNEHEIMSWVIERILATGDWSLAALPGWVSKVKVMLPLRGGPVDGASATVWSNPLIIEIPTMTNVVAVYDYAVKDRCMVFREQITKEEASKRYGNPV